LEIKKVLFVGLGGAGQRHLRIFKELLPKKTEFSAYRATKKTPLLNSNFSPNSHSTIELEYGLRLFDTLEQGFDNKPDLVVISTPSSLHYYTAKMAAERNVDIFVEKPFSHNLNGYQEFKDLVLYNNLHFFISFQRRFHPYLRKVKEIISNGEVGKIITANFNVGSYVPEWHPYEDFREFYACKRDLGGGVLLTEIHELDLCCWYFGIPASVFCTGGNFSEFKLDVEDTVHLTLDYGSYAVHVNLCFMQKHNRRDLFIAGTKGYLEWNQDGNVLIFNSYEKDEKKTLSDPEAANDDMFFSQGNYFLNTFRREDSKSYLETAWATQRIVEAAKESMTKRAMVEI